MDRSAACSRSGSSQRRRRAAQRRRRSGRQGASPRKALLQDVTYTGCSNNGTTFAVVELCDAGHCPYLTLVTGEGFGDIDCLELLRGTELSLDPASGGKVVLPLAHQSQAVLQHLLDQLLSRYCRAAAENRDATTATESLITLVQQLIRGRSFGPLQGCATTHAGPALELGWISATSVGALKTPSGDQ